MIEEYDYYGVKKTTIEDYGCIEMMEAILYDASKEGEPEVDDDGNILNNDEELEFDAEDTILTIDDKELLIEYAPQLFNTLLEPEQLEKAMLGLVKVFREYRLNGDSRYGINYIREHSPSFGAKKGRAEKEEDLVKKITQVIDLMGGDLYHKDTNTIQINPNTNEMQESDEPKATEIKDLLKRVRDNPSAYIPSRPLKPSTNKNNIKDYLFKLELANKTDTIEAFIKAIK